MINKNLKELSIEDLKKKESETRNLMILSVLFGAIILKGFWCLLVVVFLLLFWKSLDEIQKEIKLRNNIQE